MNIMINTKTSLSLFFVLALLVACDDDAKKYTAEFPRFEPLQLKLAENELPKVGKSVVVEAPQRKKRGKHLYEVTYKMAVSGPAEAVQRYGKSNLYTDRTPAPTDTITFSHPDATILYWWLRMKFQELGRDSLLQRISLQKWDLPNTMVRP